MLQRFFAPTQYLPQETGQKKENFKLTYLLARFLFENSSRQNVSSRETLHAVHASQPRSQELWKRGCTLCCGKLGGEGLTKTAENGEHLLW